MDRKIVAAQQRIDALQKKAETPPVSLDMELQSQLARFLCVLSSGLIEQATTSILEANARAKSRSEIANYVSSQLARLQNAKFEEILLLLGRFDPSWRQHIESNTPQDIRDAIDSIVNNRNQIAHGGQVGISLGTFSGYYSRVKIFIVELEKYIENV